MRYFDTHAHLNDDRFESDRDELIASLPEQGAELIVDVACEKDDFQKTLALCAKYPFIYGAYGIHPHSAGEPGEGWEEALRHALQDKKRITGGFVSVLKF